MFPASKIAAAWALFALICILAVTVVTAQSLVDLDRPEYPVPIENR